MNDKNHELLAPSAPLLEPASHENERTKAVGEPKSFSGPIIFGNFYYGDRMLRLSNVRIINIHIKAKDGEKVEGKLILGICDKEASSIKLKDGWIDTKGFLTYNTNFVFETKV